jgi:hypothetical protein
VWSDGRLVFFTSSDEQQLLAESQMKVPAAGFIASLLATYLLPEKP